MTAYLDTATDAGERRKLSAHASLVARRELYILRGRRALLTALLRRGCGTCDDVRDVVELPDGISPKLFGVVPGTLARAGIIAPDGFAKSRRREAHARPIQVWQLVDRAAAMVWLAAHPDRPDSTPEDAEPVDGQLLFGLTKANAPDAATPGAESLTQRRSPCTTTLTRNGD